MNEHLQTRVVIRNVNDADAAGKKIIFWLISSVVVRVNQGGAALIKEHHQWINVAIFWT